MPAASSTDSVIGSVVNSVIGISLRVVVQDGQERAQPVRRLPRPVEGRAAEPVAAAMARTSHVLSETPSTAAARSASPLSDSGSRRLTRAVLSSPSSAGAVAGATGAGAATRAGAALATVHVATAQAHLDRDVAAAGQLVGGGGEHVEQQQPHGGVGRRGQQPGRRLQVRTACFGGGGQVAAQLFDERVQIHDVIMTSV